MKIIVGLGNIDEKYAKTRHNCGFMVLDEFTKELKKENFKFEWKREEKFNANTARFKYKNKDILLVKPATYMNLSGLAVQKILNFYKESLENLIIIYDDIDLPLGKIRIREKGSAGTHNGMKSIIRSLGTEKIKRIRIGIEGREQITSNQQKLHDYVLSNFTQKEKEILAIVFKDTLRKLELEL